MIQLMMMLSLAGVNVQSPLAVNQVQPCVWPNRCSQEAAPVVQVQPCVWPNRCSQQAPLLAQVQTCVWPNRCEKSGQSLL